VRGENERVKSVVFIAVVSGRRGTGLYWEKETIVFDDGSIF